MNDHIHDIGAPDGRGRRKFLVNGKLVPGVFYADTKRGFVDHIRQPPKVHRRGKRVIWERVRGEVTVIYGEPPESA